MEHIIAKLVEGLEQGKMNRYHVEARGARPAPGTN
jgi:hypothetical protein